MRASRNGSARMTCTRMSGPRWPGCGMTACGSASPGTRRPGGRAFCASLELPADMIATSDDWGVTKPDPAFFRQMIKVVPCEAG